MNGTEVFCYLSEQMQWRKAISFDEEMVQARLRDDYRPTLIGIAEE